MVLLILCWQLLDKIFAVFTCAEGKAKETHHPSALLSYLSSLDVPKKFFQSLIKEELAALFLHTPWQHHQAYNSSCRSLFIFVFFCCRWDPYWPWAGMGTTKGFTTHTQWERERVREKHLPLTFTVKPESADLPECLRWAVHRQPNLIIYK